MAEKYKPPRTGKAPAAVRHRVEKIYRKCRMRNPGESKAAKEYCARTAWSKAEQQTGYVPPKRRSTKK